MFLNSFRIQKRNNNQLLYNTGRLTLFIQDQRQERQTQTNEHKKGYALGHYQRTKLEKRTDEKTAKEKKKKRERERERVCVSHILVYVGPIFIPGGRSVIRE